MVASGAVFAEGEQVGVTHTARYLVKRSVSSTSARPTVQDSRHG